MSAQRVETDGSGRPVLVKAAGPGAESDRLRREAVLLRAAAHPGVVELLDERNRDDGGVELILAVAGTRTLADLRTDLRGIADVVAALAATVADLHDLGLIHGRITVDHVVIDASGRPVLCGFAEAGPATPERGATEDVAALGTVLAGLVEPPASLLDGDWEPIPERRFGANDRWHGYARRALLTVVDQATADDPGRRPSARAFAASVLAARPDEQGRWWDGLGWPTGGRRLVTPIAAALGLGLLVFGVGGLIRPTGQETTAASAPPDGSTATDGPASEPSAPSDAAAIALTPIECPAVTAPAADVDGDGCESPVHLGDGVVEVDGVRFGVGRPGDLLAVDDWDCDGLATVALVRAGSGEVFVFDGWATGAAAEQATSEATVPRASAIEVVDPDGDGCPALVVVDERGDRTAVTT